MSLIIYLLAVVLFVMIGLRDSIGAVIRGDFVGILPMLVFITCMGIIGMVLSLSSGLLVRGIVLSVFGVFVNGVVVSVLLYVFNKVSIWRVVNILIGVLGVGVIVVFVSF